jgi:hypothetical protein
VPVAASKSVIEWAIVNAVTVAINRRSSRAHHEQEPDHERDVIEAGRDVLDARADPRERRVSERTHEIDACVVFADERLELTTVDEAHERRDAGSITAEAPQLDHTLHPGLAALEPQIGGRCVEPCGTTRFREDDLDRRIASGGVDRCRPCDGEDAGLHLDDRQHAGPQAVRRSGCGCERDEPERERSCARHGVATISQCARRSSVAARSDRSRDAACQS